VCRHKQSSGFRYIVLMSFEFSSPVKENIPMEGTRICRTEEDVLDEKDSCFIAP
jgi:hypothetical protein